MPSDAANDEFRDSRSVKTWIFAILTKKYLHTGSKFRYIILKFISKHTKNIGIMLEIMFHSIYAITHILSTNQSSQNRPMRIRSG